MVKSTNRAVGWVCRALAVVGAVLCAGGWAGGARAAGAEPPDKARIDACKRATALVLVEAGKQGSSGSAFCIDPSGLFVTNEHVVGWTAKPDKLQVVLSPGTPAQRTLTATVVRADAKADLAVLRVTGAGALDVLDLADEKAMAGLVETAEVTAFGYPLGNLLAVRGSRPEVSVTVSRISALRHAGGQLAVIQLDGSINHGNSGGPVVDGRGVVVGVVVAITKGAQSINWAIPAGQVRRFLSAAGITVVPKVRAAPAADPAAAAAAAAAAVLNVEIEPDPVARRAAPDESAEREARKLVRELRAKQFADPTPQAAAALARDLIDLAGQTTDDPTGRFGVLREAVDAAVRGGDVGLAMAAVADLGRLYEVDSLGERAAAVTRLSQRTTGAPAASAAVAAHGLAVVRALANADRLADARKLLPVVREQATASRNPAVLQRVREQLGAIETQVAEFDALKSHLERLATAPDDPAANLAVGRFYAFRRAAFDKGLPMMAKGADPALRALAQLDIGAPATADARKAVGDRWWEQAAGEVKNAWAADAAKARAAYWYRLALPELAGLAKLQAEQRVAAVPAAAANGTAVATADTARPASPASPAPGTGDAPETTKPEARGVATAQTRALTRRLNDFAVWRPGKGTWTVTADGWLRGSGDADDTFPDRLPADVVISFRVRVQKGLRPRVMFGGTGLHFGTEGYDRTLFMHGGKERAGEAIPFKNGQAYQVVVRFEGERYECSVDGKVIALGLRKGRGEIDLKVRGGDSWSAGTTDFRDFEVVLPKAGK